jgi:uncharacterized protein
MKVSRVLAALVLTLVCRNALAAAPNVGAPPPLLNITERGELTMSGDDFSFVPWRSDTNPGKVHVVQYFAASMSARDTFKPVTDMLEKSVTPGSVHVTTVLNLDAALFGTTGFVISELKKNKKIHPLATMVVDDKGLGIGVWDLGEDGAGLMILDKQGVVKYFTRKALSEQELAAALELIRANTGS